MNKLICLLLMQVFISKTFSQELYVFTEPASNMPAHSLALRTTARFALSNPLSQRYTPEAMLGINKQVMLHLSGTFSDYFSTDLKAESVKLYAKYRFLSSEEVHRHFRIAAFGDVSFSRSPYQYEEISLEGDNSGFQSGLIATQLINKLAVSAMAGYTKIFNPATDKVFISHPAYNFFSYSLSGGYLILPKEYKDYKQLNINAYVELLGEKSLDNSKYNIDLAPAVQFIFNSNSKLNIGYRFQLSGNMSRMAQRQLQLAFEHTFFNLWK